MSTHSPFVDLYRKEGRSTHYPCVALQERWQVNTFPMCCIRGKMAGQHILHVLQKRKDGRSTHSSCVALEERWQVNTFSMCCFRGKMARQHILRVLH